MLAYALRLLARRAWSAGELRQKLERRAARPEDVRAVFERLKEYGYVDDRRFAEAFTVARLESNGFGRQRVLRDLDRRRVAPGLARETVERVVAGVDETALIEDYLRRKFRNVALEEHLAEPRRLAAAYRRLRGAGFSPGNVIRVLKRFAAQADALESLEEAEDGPEKNG
ncbi:MAG: RecX family transcriptional regulator [Acidobacteria bacterium]|nr:RecX family transcriptional regulator [Acidobacteriota bacterium]